MQGLLELANVPYVGAGVLASAVGMDKAVMKVVFVAAGLAGVPVPRRAPARLAGARDAVAVGSREVARLSDVRQARQPRLERRHLQGEDASRPAGRDGSGWQRSIARSSIEAAVPKAREIECAVLGNDAPEASVPGEVIPSREFYDYEAKYLDDGSRDRHPGGSWPANRSRDPATRRSSRSSPSTAPAWRAWTSCSARTRSSSTR